MRSHGDIVFRFSAIYVIYFLACHMLILFSQPLSEYQEGLGPFRQSHLFTGLPAVRKTIGTSEGQDDVTMRGTVTDRQGAIFLRAATGATDIEAGKGKQQLVEALAHPGRRPNLGAAALVNSTRLGVFRI
jgi:hypothetical protein